MRREKNKKHGVYPIKRFNIIISAIMFVAIILGVYGQDIAYYISNNLVGISPVYFLTTLTMISIILFLIAAILTGRYIKTQSKKPSTLMKVVIIIGFVPGILISAFSIFATIMWWG